MVAGCMSPGGRTRDKGTWQPGWAHTKWDGMWRPAGRSQIGMGQGLVAPSWARTRKVCDERGTWRPAGRSQGRCAVVRGAQLGAHTEGARACGTEGQMKCTCALSEIRDPPEPPPPAAAVAVVVLVPAAASNSAAPSAAPAAAPTAAPSAPS
jgi:hypothetical protein